MPKITLKFFICQNQSPKYEIFHRKKPAQDFLCQMMLSERNKFRIQYTIEHGGKKNDERLIHTTTLTHTSSETYVQTKFSYLSDPFNIISNDKSNEKHFAFEWFALALLSLDFSSFLCCCCCCCVLIIICRCARFKRANTNEHVHKLSITLYCA